MESMHRIKAVSATVLADASAVTAEDSVTKKDVMSLLVRARRAEKGDEGGYKMKDEEMMEQVVRALPLSLRICVIQLKSLSS